MALPAIADLRRAAPAATVTVAARASVAPLFTMVPGVDRTIVLDKTPGTTDAVQEVQQGGFEVAVLLPNSWRSAWLVWRGGVGERWGYRTDWRRPLLTRAVSRPRAVHQGAYYQALTRALGAPSGPLEPKLVPTTHALDRGADALARAGWDKTAPLVAMAPGAAYGTAKRWPAQAFASVADHLVRDGMQVVLAGASADRAASHEVMMALESRTGVMNLTGTTDLPTFAGLLAQCRALVSNDSGAMHVGAAVGLRVTALFGPTREDETRPLGPGHTVLTVPVWCRPCMLRTCPIDHRCMRRIEPGRVLAAVMESL
jgi:heptosyltransferase-2